MQKMTPELLRSARTLYRQGSRCASIARILGVSPDTIRRWLDPDYDRYRKYKGKAVPAPPVPGAVPTLPFVPNIEITGRYQMRRSTP